MMRGCAYPPSRHLSRSCATNANVPHIFGESDTDVFHGLGFAHAQDRLWQMMMLRRTAQGRLSELFGTTTVDVDSFVRRLDIYRLSVESVEAQDPDTRAALEAYASGVNARLDQINAEALGRGAPEMFLFNTPLAPWRPADSIAVAKLMGLQLSGHLSEEVLRARMSLALDDPARLADILPDVPAKESPACPNTPLSCLAWNTITPPPRRNRTRCLLSNRVVLPEHPTRGPLPLRDRHRGGHSWPMTLTLVSRPLRYGIWRDWNCSRAGSSAEQSRECPWC